MEEQIRFLYEHADFLHMDIKDGNYVKTFGINPDFLNYIKPIVKKPMDAHLMVKNPQDFIESCAQAGAAYITPYTDCIESDAFVIVNKIKSLGCKAGIALNPASSLEAIRYYLPMLDKVTIMIVDAGYAGQTVIPYILHSRKHLTIRCNEIPRNLTHTSPYHIGIKKRNSPGPNAHLSAAWIQQPAKSRRNT